MNAHYANRERIHSSIPSIEGITTIFGDRKRDVVKQHVGSDISDAAWGGVNMYDSISAMGAEDTQSQISRTLVDGC